MRIRQMVMCTALTAGLAAQGSDQGFKWVGIRAGSLSFDSQENVKSTTFLGGQGGLVFDQQRFGLSFEGLLSHPKSDLSPDKTLNHSEVSVTLMTGLSSDPSSKFWPYLGLGLGAISLPKISPSTLALETTKGGAAHLSLGFLHRPGLGLIWGMEGRYLLTFTPKDMKEIQGSVLFGFTWGGRGVTPRTEAYVPPAKAIVPPPPAPPPVVEAAPPPPAPLPVVETAPPPPAPLPVVEAAPPPPAPLPVVETAPLPPPPPAAAPVLLAISPATGAKVAEEVSTRTERLDALRQGHLAKALELGRKRIEAIPPHHWTIRLEIANLPSTLKNAVEAFPGREPDLFITPIKLRGGKTAYQLFLGEYASKAEAERAAKAVPPFFLEGGQRPRPFLGAGIPAQ